MKKLWLVTGGAGFIGSTLCEKIIKENRVVVVDNFNRYYSPLWKKRNVSKIKNHSDYYLIKADIRDENALKDIFSRFTIDGVIHLAAMAGVRPSIENPKLYTEVNVTGTTLLFEQMRKAQVKRLIFASSSSVYGNRTMGPFKETDNTDCQVSIYGATKKAGELLCHVYASLYGINTIVLRFFTVYGPRNRPDMACYKFVKSISEGRPLIKFGEGNTGRDYTYVDDTVDGIMKAMEVESRFEIINLGNAKPILLNDVIKIMEKEIGKKAIINQLPLQQGDVGLTYADIEKAKRILKYQPKSDFRSGMEKLVNWYHMNQS